MSVPKWTFACALLLHVALATVLAQSPAPIPASYCVGLDVDGVADEWDSCDSPETIMSLRQVGAIVSGAGSNIKTDSLKLRFAHDGTNIYLLAKVAGEYYLNLTAQEANALSHSVSVMWRIGEQAIMLNMGGCEVPAPRGDPYNCTDIDLYCEENPEECDTGCEDYLTDVWHIETGSPGSIPGVQYPYRGPIVFPDGANYKEFVYMSEGTGEYQPAVERLMSGNDHQSNSDDEYSVHSCIRSDDGNGFTREGVSYRNQIRFAWSHTAIDSYKYPFATIGADGEYIYEFSRPLKTNENTDAQFTLGENADFAFAFWTPAAADVGWEAANHFVAPTDYSFRAVTLIVPELSDGDDNGAMPVTLISSLVWISAIVALLGV